LQAVSNNRRRATQISAIVDLAQRRMLCVRGSQMKAIVLTCDRFRAITAHMILQYERLWPEHPFVFHVPYQTLRGSETQRTKYIKTPENIRATALQLIADLDDEEWVYWCIDDKYPIRLLLDKIEPLISDAVRTTDMSGLLFCRCRVTLTDPKRALYPDKIVSPSGEVLLERKAWFQIWLHQLLKVKVLRYLFSHLPEEIPNAKAMDEFKDKIPKLPEHRLFVSEKNFAVFGESTHRGAITQNCYESITASGIELPEWFRQPNGERIIMGTL
jgi:hypothetical protein